MNEFERELFNLYLISFPIHLIISIFSYDSPYIKDKFFIEYINFGFSGNNIINNNENDISSILLYTRIFNFISFSFSSIKYP